MIYRLLHFFLKLLSYIPFRMLYILSDGLFYPLYYIVRYRRKVVRKNLTESFPEKSLSEIKQIEKNSITFYRHDPRELQVSFHIPQKDKTKNAVHKYRSSKFNAETR